MKLLISFTLIVILAACDIPRPSSVICDCQVQPDSKLSEWSRLEQAPANFVPGEIWRLHQEPMTDYFGAPEVFDAASVHWYRNSEGQSLACVVNDGSNYVNAIFIFAADIRQTAPDDFRLLGIPFSRSPYFWERCISGDRF